MPHAQNTKFRPDRVRSVNELAHALRRIRKSRKMTQAGLARRTCMHAHHISMIETGATIPKASTLFALFAALEVDMILTPRGQDEILPQARIEDIF